MPPSSDSGESVGWVKGDLPPAEPQTQTPPAEELAPEESQPEAPAPEAPVPESPALEEAAPETAESEAAPPEDAAPQPDPKPAAGAANGALSVEALVESLLFVADGAVTIAQIAEALEVAPRVVETALTALADNYAAGQRGLSLQRIRDKVQLTTAPAAAPKVERFLGLAATTPLTRASLETLAIVAYQQPVTRPQIEAVRGVNSDSVLKNLLSKGLIEEVGRTDGPGRPVLYSTTPEFLQHFGLSSLAELPALNIEPAPAAPEAPPAEADPPRD